MSAQDFHPMYINQQLAQDEKETRIIFDQDQEEEKKIIESTEHFLETIGYIPAL